MTNTTTPVPRPPRFQVISIVTKKVAADHLQSHEAAVKEAFRLRAEGAGPLEIKKVS